MIDSEKLISLWKRQNEITKRVVSGGLDIDLALSRTQNILDDIYPSRAVFTPPIWYESPETQIRTVSEFLGQNGNEPGFTADDIPAPPSDFVPRTPTEVLMLVVTLPDKDKVKLTQRNFDALWNFIVPPKWRWSELISNTKFLRYIKGICKKPGMRWVGFDPEAYIGLSPDQALAQAAKDGITLASDEVLMAAALFKNWVKCCDSKKWHYPNMSAYQFEYGDERRTPYLRHWGHAHARQLEISAHESELSAHESVISDVGWSSPGVREL